MYDTGGRGFTSDLSPPATDWQPASTRDVWSAGVSELGRYLADGGLIAYSSSESGRFEASSRPSRKRGALADGTEGGRYPALAGRCRGAVPTSGDDVMVVEVRTGRAMFEWECPDGCFTIGGLLSRGLDVSPDGQRFAAVEGTRREPQRLTTALLNWTTQLK